MEADRIKYLGVDGKITFKKILKKISCDSVD